MTLPLAVHTLSWEKLELPGSGYRGCLGLGLGYLRGACSWQSVAGIREAGIGIPWRLEPRAGEPEGTAS